MSNKSVHLVSGCLLCVLMSGPGLAEDTVQAEEINKPLELRVVVNGNTVEGRNVKSHSTYTAYFHPSGRLARQTAKQKLERGSWRVADGEKLCVTTTSEECYDVRRRGEGEYDLTTPQGELLFTIDKVILGNPNKFDAKSARD